MTTTLSVLGSLLILLGLYAGYQSLAMHIDVDGTVNLSLVQTQTINFAFGATAFLAGTVMVVGACLYYALTQRNG